MLKSTYPDAREDMLEISAACRHGETFLTMFRISIRKSDSWDGAAEVSAAVRCGPDVVRDDTVEVSGAVR